MKTSVTLDDAVYAAKHLFNLIDQLAEVEDDYYETWLMCGVPDGMSIGELIDDLLEDFNLYKEYRDLATKLLLHRALEEDE